MDNKSVFQVFMWDSNKEFRNYVVVTSDSELAKVIVSNQHDKEVLDAEDNFILNTFGSFVNKVSQTYKGWYENCFLPILKKEQYFNY